MRRTIIVNLSFLCVAAIIILGLVFASGQSSPNTPVSDAKTQVTVKKTPTTVPTPAPAPTTFTAAQVAGHSGRSSCWTIVRGNVYDVTSWISQHPGGSEAILGMCGVDATSEFVDQHGGQRRPESELASFKIGTLR